MELEQMWLFHGCDPSLTFLTTKRNSGDSGTQRQEPAGAAAAAGPRPADKTEITLVALLVATHGAAMGTIADQKPAGRRESLSQANELARCCAALMEVIDRHRALTGAAGIGG